MTHGFFDDVDFVLVIGHVMWMRDARRSYALGDNRAYQERSRLLIKGYALERAVFPDL